MTREEQIIKIGAQFAIDETDGQTSGRAASMRGVLLSAFRAGAQWADSYPNWISVDEELPPKRKDPLVISDKVFIRTTGEDYLSAVYDYQDKQWIDVYNIETLESNKVTHWMPIVLPKGGGE